MNLMLLIKYNYLNVCKSEIDDERQKEKDRALNLIHLERDPQR